MAKQGIDSFLLDCRSSDDMAEIEATFGIKGFAVIVRLWQKIYGEKGYYCEWKERSPVLFLTNWFGGNSGVSINFICEVVEVALRIGIFDKQMYDRYSILTSKEIQEKYFEVTKRRKEIEVDSRFIMADVDNFQENVCRNRVSANKNQSSESKIALSKGKESKVKESKGKQSKEKKSEKKDADASPSPVPDAISSRSFSPEVESAVREWIAYKTEKRQTYKETGLRNFLTQVENHVRQYGDKAVVDLIGLCMSQNWQGVIWDKLDQTPRRKSDVTFDENGNPWPVIDGVDWSTV